MPKSIHNDDYKIFCALLREVRERAEVSQMALAHHMKRTQTFISAAERAEVRLDFVQIREWCLGCRTTVAKLALLFERRAKPKPHQAPD